MPRGAPRLRTEQDQQNLVGPTVKATRKQLALTQDALCARLATATSGRWSPTIFDIYRIESQRRIVSDMELLALAIALECDLYDLLGTTKEATTLPG
ncbi:helix-turn-helix domain-containing protein [Armatimonas rosea]|uniref:Transcriptional regulator with XRE-family HTH domain n=1 Tax=Armatimonas rosea TaxID=685828 RepID=A0A7W9SRN0_ARMRO|nr:helix-turn-helix transcriptional regulator [Armatimonas rosea]MBB6050729.1 transcriptional regulator with XRE-family HTH domain [Armatimonas rosea]